MKRRLCIAMILALFSTCVYTPSLAEAVEDICAPVEEQVAPAEQAGDTGLFVEEEVPQTAEAPVEAAVEAPAQSFSTPLARVLPECILVYQNVDSTQPIVALGAGSVVLRLSQEALVRVAVYTQYGMVEGYTDPAWLAELTEAEFAGYLDGIAAGTPAVFYADDTNLPLALVTGEFQDEAQTAQPDAAVMAPGDLTEAATVVTDPAAVPVTGIQMNTPEVTIGYKEVYTGLSVVAVPTGSIVPAVSWRSDNTKYVKVEETTGAIYGAKKGGSANVYAMMADGSEVACLVNVDKAPKKITLEPSKLTLSSGGMTAQLTWALPKGGTTHNITFASNNPSVVTVDANGLVTSVGPGSAVVAVKTHNGKKDKCKITVIPAPASISLPAGGISLAVGQRCPIGAVALSSDGKTVESTYTYAIKPYYSADTGCVALDPATGEVTGLRKGQAVIDIATYNGITASCPVVVAAAPAAIRLSEDEITLGVKDTYSNLSVQLDPAPGETDFVSTVAWTVSNPKIIKVDEATGAIYGLKKGNCTLTATTINGLTASCSVNVVKAPKKISLDPSSATLEVGQTGQYKVNYSSKAGGRVRFDTSDPSIATIDDDGVVTAVSPGTVAILATSYNGRRAAAKLVVAQPSVYLPVDDNISVESNTSEYSDSMSNAQKLEYVIYVAQTQLNKPYKYGGGYSKDSNPSGFDCSGLVYWCFLHIGVKVEASAYRQGYDETQPKITNALELKRGDIVCFNTNDSDSDASDHTGIYLGNGKFIHASSSAKKVIVSTLASGYYSRTFSWGRRVLP